VFVDAALVVGYPAPQAYVGCITLQEQGVAEKQLVECMGKDDDAEMTKPLTDT
jgi:hypothetical protein